MDIDSNRCRLPFQTLDFTPVSTPTLSSSQKENDGFITPKMRSPSKKKRRSGSARKQREAQTRQLMTKLQIELTEAQDQIADLLHVRDTADQSQAQLQEAQKQLSDVELWIAHVEVSVQIHSSSSPSGPSASSSEGKELCSRMKSINTAIQRLKTKKSMFSSLVDEQIKQMSSQKDQIQAQGIHINELCLEVKQLNSLIQSYKSEQDEMTLEVQTLLNEQADFVEQISELENQVCQQSCQNSELLHNNQELSSSLEQLQQEFQTQELSLNVAQNGLRRRGSEINQLELLARNQREKLASLEEEKEELKLELEKLALDKTQQDQDQDKKQNKNQADEKSKDGFAFPSSSSSSTTTTTPTPTTSTTSSSTTASQYGTFWSCVGAYHMMQIFPDELSPLQRFLFAWIQDAGGQDLMQICQESLLARLDHTRRLISISATALSQSPELLHDNDDDDDDDDDDDKKQNQQKEGKGKESIRTSNSFNNDSFDNESKGDFTTATTPHNHNHNNNNNNNDNNNNDNNNNNNHNHDNDNEDDRNKYASLQHNPPMISEHINLVSLEKELELLSESIYESGTETSSDLGIE